MQLTEREIVMDRKKLLDYLIKFALDRGAVIHFGSEVKGPLLESGVVAGLLVGGKKHRASLVIDSAGMASPVRTSLPESYGILRRMGPGEVIHVYRAYYDIRDEVALPLHDFPVHLMPLGIKGIAWVRVLERSSDVLVGSIDPLDRAAVDRVLAYLRRTYPGIGDKIVRGGRIARIPLRRPLPLLVGHNYAVLGDAAAMTVPVIGSGMENSMLAGRLLAETVIAVGAVAPHRGIWYHREDLWDYQYRFYRKAGARLCFLDRIKTFLLTEKPDRMNSYLRMKIVTASDFQKPLLGQEVTVTGGEMFSRFLGAWYRPDLLLPLKSVLGEAARARDIALEIPATWDESLFREWKRKLEECYPR